MHVHAWSDAVSSARELLESARRSVVLERPGLRPIAAAPREIIDYAMLLVAISVNHISAQQGDAPEPATDADPA